MRNCRWRWLRSTALAETFVYIAALLNVTAGSNAQASADPVESETTSLDGDASADGRCQAQRSDLACSEARKIAKDAYIFGFPLVENYRVMHSFFVDRGNEDFKAPWNQIHNETRVFTPDDKTIQTPNSDTPYSQLGTDLRTEPLVITVPEVSEERYYSLQFIDLYTHNYAYVGSRATGNEAGSFLLAGPNWKGKKPNGVKAVIRSETELGWVQFRTQLFSPDDIDDVKKVQAGYTVEPLSTFLGKSAPPAAPNIDFRDPLHPGRQKTSPEFFELLLIPHEYSFIMT